MLARLAGGTTPAHVAGCYAGLIDALVLDEADARAEHLAVRPVVTRTLMTDADAGAAWPRRCSRPPREGRDRRRHREVRRGARTRLVDAGDEVVIGSRDAERARGPPVGARRAGREQRGRRSRRRPRRARGGGGRGRSTPRATCARRSARRRCSRSRRARLRPGGVKPTASASLAERIAGRARRARRRGPALDRRGEPRRCAAGPGRARLRRRRRREGARARARGPRRRRPRDRRRPARATRARSRA